MKISTQPIQHILEIDKTGKINSTNQVFADNLRNNRTGIRPNDTIFNYLPGLDPNTLTGNISNIKDIALRMPGISPLFVDLSLMKIANGSIIAIIDNNRQRFAETTKMVDDSENRYKNSLRECQQVNSALIDTENKYKITVEFQELLRDIFDIATSNQNLDKSLEMVLDKILNLSWLSDMRTGSIVLARINKKSVEGSSSGDNNGINLIKGEYSWSGDLKHSASIGNTPCPVSEIYKYVQHGKIIKVFDLDHGHGFTGDTGKHGHLFVPIMDKSNLMGALELTLHQDHKEIDGIENFLSDLGYAISHLIDRKRNIERLQKLAFYDALTEIRNRMYFHSELANFIARANSTTKREGDIKRNKSELATFFFDVNGFKEVNDTQGHGIGDEYLIEIARRLNNFFRRSDEEIVGRQSGDEFMGAFFTENIGTANDTINKLIKVLTEPITFSNGVTIKPRVSFGVNMHNVGETNGEDLIKKCDQAMYKAKHNMPGDNQFAFYDASMDEANTNRSKIASKLESAIEKDEFMLEYQPQVDVTTGNIVGIECLLRWKTFDDEGKKVIMQPNDFMTIAEENGLIIKIGDLVFKKICADIKSFTDAGIANIRFGMNMSPLQLKAKVTDTLLGIIQESGVDPNFVNIEFTEKGTENPRDKNYREKIAEKLRELKERGISITLDNFLSGTKSIDAMWSLPLSCVKISREFISGILNDKDKLDYVKLAIYMAKSRGITSIAEGVETEEQFNLLKELGCDIVQGYHAGRPMSFEEVKNKASKNKS